MIGCTHHCTPSPSTAKAKPAFKRVTHVIFDLDGLLLDTENIHAKVFADIAKEYGKILTAETRAKLLGRREYDVASTAIAEMDLPLTTEQFVAELRSRARPKLSSDCQFMPGAERLVKHFHSMHVPIAVATSSTKESFDIKTEKHKNVFSLFHHIVTGGSDPEVKQGKPSPDIFLICASRFPDNPRPEQCLVLEDAPNGITAAVAAGMQCIMVPDSEVVKKPPEEATQVLKSLEDVRPELYGLPPLISTQGRSCCCGNTKTKHCCV